MPMQASEKPADERDRLLALYRLGLLDTAPSESFDRVTQLAAEAMQVPIILMSLVDSERQWFKSRVGLDAHETSREISVCSHVVFERIPLVINDLTADPRFSSNPLVTGEPQARAYLGVPLFTLERQPIGALCAIDVKCRRFSDRDLQTMVTFAKIAEELVHARELASRTQAILKLATENEALYRKTFEQAAVGIVHKALDGRFIRFNRHTCEMLGYGEAELKRITFVDITHTDDIPKDARLFQQLIVGENNRYRIEKRFVRKNGSVFWADLSVSLIRDLQGLPDYAIAVIEDISERKAVEAELIRARDSLTTEVALQTKQLREKNQSLLLQVKKSLEFELAQRRSERRTRAIADAIPAMVGYWNRQLICEFANETYRQWTGIDPAQIVGMSMRDLVGEKMFREFEPNALLALDGHERRFELTLKKADGSISFVEGRYIPDFDDSGGVRGIYAYIADVTRLRAAHTELETLNAQLHLDSTTDYLTGIANRRVFSERSEDAARNSQTTGQPYGLILIDLDNFKLVNDGHGHNVGDNVLRMIGRVLREQLRGRDDIGARLGGEEFAVLCFGDLDENGLTQLAERIRGQINGETIHDAKSPVRVTCSFGLALSRSDDSDWKSIYARADSALYEAKANGKDRVIFGRYCAKGHTGRFRSIRIATSQ